tara:strand:- start:4063 stop:4938 length:876 start_codon:yes stop_codon:yes gene_type:complete
MTDQTNDLSGISLKAQHYDDILASPPPVGWFEVHPENYMCDGGPAHHYLTRIRHHYDISLHGVGLSIGGAEPLNRAHLTRLKRLVDRYDPIRFSEHLAWSSHGGKFFNDLLPLPYNRETLALVCDHVSETQDFLGRRMLLENPSTYLRFTSSDIDEPAFLAEISRKTGCGLLLDINNVIVSCTNQKTSPDDWLNAFPLGHADQIHLAGHAIDRDEAGAPLLIDSHDRKVDLKVWSLFEEVIRQRGSIPTLIEWDDDIPPLDVLLAEAATADAIMKQVSPTSEKEACHAMAG